MTLPLAHYQDLLIQLKAERGVEELEALLAEVAK